MHHPGRNAQFTGGGRHIARIFFKSFDQEFPFVGIKPGGKAAPGLRSGSHLLVVTGFEGWRQVVAVDTVTLSRKHGPLQTVFQFAHIAGLGGGNIDC